MTRSISQHCWKILKHRSSTLSFQLYQVCSIENPGQKECHSLNVQAMLPRQLARPPRLCPLPPGGWVCSVVSPPPSHLLTSVLGLQVPHRRCSVAWGQAEDLPALLEKPGTLVGWGLFFPSAAVVPLAFDSSKCKLSTLQQLWSIATLRIHVKWLW